MSEDVSNPQINISKIPGGAGIAGALVAISIILIGLVGIPALRYFLLGAIVLGFGIFGLIRLMHKLFPPKPPERVSLSINEER